MELEEEEMMYLDGEWSWNYLKGNVQALAQRYWNGLGFQIVASDAGMAKSQLQYCAMTVFKSYFPKISIGITKIAGKIASLFTGWIGFAIAAVASIGIVSVLASWRLFY